MTTDDLERTIEVAAALSRPADEIARLLMTDAPFVIAGIEDADSHRLVVPLEVPMGQHGSVRRPAVLDLGIPERKDGVFRMPLKVTALDSERWFPTFDGALETLDADIGEATLRMTGRYSLPLGAVGRATGALGGDRAARASLYALFLEIVAGAEREIRATAVAWRPAAAGESLRESQPNVGA